MVVLDPGPLLVVAAVLDPDLFLVVVVVGVLPVGGEGGRRGRVLCRQLWLWHVVVVMIMLMLEPSVLLLSGVGVIPPRTVAGEGGEEVVEFDIVVAMR